MSSVVGDIAISIGADIAPLVSNLGKGQAAIAKFGKTAETTSSGGMAKFAIAAGAMAGAIVAGLPALARWTSATLDQAGALHDASMATGVQVSSLQAMTQVANEASVSTSSLVSGLQKMQNNITGLAQGTKAQTEAFGRLGISITDLSGKGADEQFAIIAARIDAIADPTEKTAAAMDLFGKSGADLIPIMSNYASTLAEVAKAQQDSGISQTQEQNAALDEMGDNLGRVGMALQGLGAELLVAFGPMTLEAIRLLTGSIEGLHSAFEDFKDAVTTTEVEAKINKISEAEALAARNARGAADEALNLASWLDEVGDPETANVIRLQAAYMLTMADNLESGAMQANEFKGEMDRTIGVVQNLAAAAQGLDKLTLVNAISEMGKYGQAIATALGFARSLATLNVNTRPDGGGSNGVPGVDVQPGGNTPGGVRPQDKPFELGIYDSSGGGGGSKTDQLAADLEALQASLQSKADIEMTAYQKSQQLLTDALAAKKLTQEQFNADMELLQADHQNRMSQIDAGSYGDSLQKTGAYFGVLADTFMAGNEKMQKAGRIFGAAEALVNAWRAYTQTLADPTLPFFAKFAAGAAVLSAGLGAVQAIKSGSSSRGGASASGGAAAASTGSAAAPTQGPLQVSFQGLDPNSLYSGGMIRTLFDKLTDEAGDRGFTFVGAA